MKSRNVLIGLVGGVLITYIIGLPTASLSPAIVFIFLPVFAGALFTGYIIKSKGWLYGLLVTIIDLILLVFVLVAIGIPMMKSASTAFLLFVESIPRDWIRLFSPLLCGALGGYLGEYLGRWKICCKKSNKYK